jgi:cellulose synthase/poly-beta-1,6-N-acetylglucosamine synthase-like glycosyltransferase
MTGLFGGLSLVLFFINIYYLFWIYRGLKKVENSNPAINPNIHSFSIIIAAHNEADNISKCLEGLINQNFPKTNYEIIVIAERCTDRTIQLVNQFKPKFSNLELIEVNDELDGISPKKYALNKGIEKANYDHLVFLDADVIPTPNHLKIINQYFNGDTQIVVSLMKLSLQNNFCQEFLRYERLCNWAVATGGIGNRTPVISYGGNWAYTRQAFNQVNGFEGIFHPLGGDDDLLLQKFGKAKLKVCFCTNPEGWVTTAAPNSFQEFLQQRKRHIAAGKYYQLKFKSGYFLYHVTNLLLWIMWIFFLPALILLGLKIFTNVVLIAYSTKIFKERINKFRVIIFEFIFLLYNGVIGALGFLGRAKW